MNQLLLAVAIYRLQLLSSRVMTTRVTEVIEANEMIFRAPGHFKNGVLHKFK